jgi:PDZ domain-containing protein
MKLKLFIFLIIYVVNPVFGDELKKYVVKISVTTQHYDFLSPWKKKSVFNSKLTGVVIGENRILTLSYPLSDAVLVQVSKYGSKKRYKAEVEILDYNLGIAIIKIKNNSFFSNLKKIIINNDGNIYHKKSLMVKWDNNGAFKKDIVEISKSSIKKVSNDIHNSDLFSLVHLLDRYLLDLELGEPLFLNQKLLGILLKLDSEKKIVYILSSDVIKRVLYDLKDGIYHGVPFFNINTENIQSDVNLRNYLGFTSVDNGVFVGSISELSSGWGHLHKGDVILNIDDNNIDDNGMYISKKFEKLNYKNLFYFNKFPGDKIKMQILRNNKKIKVEFTLKKLSDENIIKPVSYDKPPEYLIYKGLILQNLTYGYIKLWGVDWPHKGNRRLVFNYFKYLYKKEKVKRRIIILNRILPDSINSGYEGKKFLILKYVNGKNIVDLKDLFRVLKESESKYIKFDFLGGDSILLKNENENENGDNGELIKKFKIKKGYFFID